MEVQEHGAVPLRDETAPELLGRCLIPAAMADEEGAHDRRHVAVRQRAQRFAAAT
jgi:hypothetical protein